MMFRVLAGALLLASSPAVPQTAPAQPPLHKTLYSDDTPPERFRGEAAVILVMVDPAKINDLCGKAPAGMTTLACTSMSGKAPVTVMPNPCAFDDEPYAHVLCHEKGHALGWPADHGD